MCTFCVYLELLRRTIIAERSPDYDRHSIVQMRKALAPPPCTERAATYRSWSVARTVKLPPQIYAIQFGSTESSNRFIYFRGFQSRVPFPLARFAYCVGPLIRVDVASARPASFRCVRTVRFVGSAIGKQTALLAAGEKTADRFRAI